MIAGNKALKYLETSSAVGNVGNHPQTMSADAVSICFNDYIWNVEMIRPSAPIREGLRLRMPQPCR
jgi:hypothetical protein